MNEALAKAPKGTGALIQAPGGQEILYRINETVAAGFRVVDINLGGKNKEAGAALRKVLTLDPTNATVHFHLGTIAVGENKVPEAVSELEKFVAGTGQSPQDLATAKKLIAALKPKK